MGYHTSRSCNVVVGSMFHNQAPARREILYTGSKTIVENEPQAPLTEDALTELDAALDKAPSTKILGFVPIPFKMCL